MRILINILILTILVFPALAAPVAVHYDRDVEDHGGGSKTLTVYGGPKYYKSAPDTWATIDPTWVTDPNPLIYRKCHTGVYQITLYTDGKIEITHRGYTHSIKLDGIGFFNNSTKEWVKKSNLTISSPVIDGNKITFDLPLGCKYRVYYHNDKFRDVVAISQTAKDWLADRIPEGWSLGNVWVGLIYEFDHDSDFEGDGEKDTGEGFDFTIDSKVAHRLLADFVRHEDDETETYQRKFRIIGSNFIDATKLSALESTNGFILFNATEDFQVGDGGSYSDCEDTYIQEDVNTTNYGAKTSMEILYNASGYDRVALVRFPDFIGPNEGQVASGSTVSSATLSLRTLSSTNNGAGNLYATRRNWVEGTENGGTSGTGATWDTYDGSNNWGTSGARNTTSDIYNTNVGSYDDTTNWGYTDCDITDICQQWVTGTWSNYGVLIENDSSDIDQWDPASAEYSNLSYNPKLSVTYTEPAAGGAGQVIIIQMG